MTSIHFFTFSGPIVGIRILKFKHYFLVIFYSSVWTRGSTPVHLKSPWIIIKIIFRKNVPNSDVFRQIVSHVNRFLTVRVAIRNEPDF